MPASIWPGDVCSSSSSGAHAPPPTHCTLFEWEEGEKGGEGGGPVPGQCVVTVMINELFVSINQSAAEALIISCGSRHG